MKRRNFLAITFGLMAQLPLEALAASKKPTPKAKPKPTPKVTKKAATPTPTSKATPSATPKPVAAPKPEELPVLRDGDLIKLADLVAPISFYASVTKGSNQIPLLVSKPTERTLKIFTARCPHQGSILNLSAQNEFSCDRHGARFNDSTGKVIDGPTISNLESYEAIERNGSIYIVI
jgi:nitrite reductase/ring-hydroxylating ferredoxin subunit